MRSIPKLLGDRYEVVRRVGSGGMADVYLARDGQLGRQVALKVLHTQYSRDQSFVERFRREARAAANLQHPNIVSIYNWGREGNFHFIVMEYVDGRSLKDVIAAEAPIDPRSAAQIASKMLLALDHAHRGGLVHRDVKPGNILLGPAEDVHVADFGIARASTGDTMTQTGTILGTAYYLSPEQAQGLDVDARSDVYSAGVVLYEMLTGRRPFEGDSPVAIAYKHVREQPVPPSRVRGGIPGGLEAIVLKAMAKKPDDRYSSAGAMLQDLTAFLEGRQVTAVIPVRKTDDSTQVIDVVGAGTRKRAATKRPGWALAAAISLLIGGLALGAFSLVNLFRPTLGASKVPNIVGQPPTEAARKLRQAGLAPAFQGNEASDTIGQGLVTRQRPDATARVTRGAEIKYWVSSGRAFVGVPDLKGQTFDQARRTLQDAGLQTGRRQDVFDQAPAGTVLEQNPRAGEEVRTGTAIDLTVSRGPEQGTVPDVIGLTEAAAISLLSREGFFVARQEGFSDRDPGRVFDQDPKPGTEAEKDSTVTIFVSQGPQTFAMPDVVGMTEDDATAVLESRGLVVLVERGGRTGGQPGRVLAQDPPAGSTVRRGEEVTITVSQ